MPRHKYGIDVLVTKASGYYQAVACVKSRGRRRHTSWSAAKTWRTKNSRPCGSGGSALAKTAIKNALRSLSQTGLD